MLITQRQINQIISESRTAFWLKVFAVFPDTKTNHISSEMRCMLNRGMNEALTEWINVNITEVKTVEILLHNVEYWSETITDYNIDDYCIEQIAYLISTGIDNGEIVDNDNDEEMVINWKINNH